MATLTIQFAVPPQLANQPFATQMQVDQGGQLFTVEVPPGSVAGQVMQITVPNPSAPVPAPVPVPAAAPAIEMIAPAPAQAAPSMFPASMQGMVPVSMQGMTMQSMQASAQASMQGMQASAQSSMQSVQASAQASMQGMVPVVMQTPGVVPVITQAPGGTMELQAEVFAPGSNRFTGHSAEVLKQVAMVKDENYPFGEADVIRANQYNALSFPQIVTVVLRTGDTIFSYDENSCQQLFHMLDTTGSGELTLNAIFAARHMAEVQNYIEHTKQPLLRNLFVDGDDHKVAKAFKRMDQSKTGTITLQDWMSMIRRQRKAQLEYYNSWTLIKRKCYRGLGLDPSRTVQCAWPWRGWWSDLWYFTKNNHPFFVMFCVDKDHPFERGERFVDLFVANMMTLLGAALVVLVATEDDEDSGIWMLWSLLLSTIPTMAVQKVSFYMQGCPCLLVDKSEKAWYISCMASILNWCSVPGGCCLVCLGLIFLIAAFSVGLTGQTAGVWAYAIVQTWCFWMVRVAVIEFQPYTWMRSLFEPVRKLTMGIINVGQWQRERAVVLETIREKIHERGEDQFFNASVSMGEP